MPDIGGDPANVSNEPGIPWWRYPATSGGSVFNLQTPKPKMPALAKIRGDNLLWFTAGISVTALVGVLSRPSHSQNTKDGNVRKPVSHESAVGTAREGEPPTPRTRENTAPTVKDRTKLRSQLLSYSFGNEQLLEFLDGLTEREARQLSERLATLDDRLALQESQLARKVAAADGKITLEIPPLDPGINGSTRFIRELTEDLGAEKVERFQKVAPNLSYNFAWWGAAKQTLSIDLTEKYPTVKREFSDAEQTRFTTTLSNLDKEDLKRFGHLIGKLPDAEGDGRTR